MIRLVNDMNGFSYFNTTNLYEISDSKFPPQYGNFLDRYTTISFKDTTNYQKYYRFRISDRYSNYNTVSNTDIHPKFFRIVRFDKGGPDKAILIGTKNGEVIVAKAYDLLQLQNIDVDFCNKIKNRAKLAKYDYFEPNETLSGDEIFKFFNSYNKEIIYEYPVQDFDLLGREVWIEYRSNLTQTKTVNNIITTEDYETGEKVPVKNDFSFTEEMKQRLLKENPRYLHESELLKYYPFTRNIHAQSNIDLPRRTTKKGIIIRADVQSVEPHIVVMEYGDSNVRFVCDDEANFYIDTTIKNDGSTFNAFDTASYYTPTGYSTDSSSQEEEEVEPETPEEEESEEEEKKELSYDDVVIYLKDKSDEEEEIDGGDETDDTTIEG